MSDHCSGKEEKCKRLQMCRAVATVAFARKQTLYTANCEARSLCRDAPPIFAGGFEAHGCVVHDVVKAQPFGAMRLVAEGERAIRGGFERRDAIHIKLALAHHNADAAHPSAFVAVVADVAVPLFRVVERFGAGVSRA